MQVVVSSLVDTVDLAREAARKRSSLRLPHFGNTSIHAFAPNGVKKVEQSPHILVGNQTNSTSAFFDWACGRRCETGWYNDSAGV
jgi:hypothetical protein